MYGTSDDSWCPSCHRHGEVMKMEGQLPSPGMYGSWLAQQQRAERERRSLEGIDKFLKQSAPKKETEPVKRKKTHTGTYHCPRCFIELDLFAEESLKCDQCEGPLSAGTLDEMLEDENGDQD